MHLIFVIQTICIYLYRQIKKVMMSKLFSNPSNIELDGDVYEITYKDIVLLVEAEVDVDKFDNKPTDVRLLSAELYTENSSAEMRLIRKYEEEIEELIYDYEWDNAVDNYDPIKEHGIVNRY